MCRRSCVSSTGPAKKKRVGVINFRRAGHLEGGTRLDELCREQHQREPKQARYEQM